MIYILHGENINDSHRRLLDISRRYPTFEKLYLESNQLEELKMHATSVDLLGNQKLIIAEDLIGKGKLKANDVEIFSRDDVLILWERKQLAPKELSAYSKIATQELFKPPSTLFYFLDSIGNSPKETIKILQKLPPKELTSIFWQILNRLNLLLFAKMGMGREESGKILEKGIADWQWQKIKSQANRLDLTTVKQMIAATLKLDYLTKTGKTDIPPKTLVSLLLLKYLKG